jgi:hypothetical protein
MKDTIAIVGSHPGSMRLFDTSRDDCDVWAFNEALGRGDIPRADAVFQMHVPTIWRSSQNRNHNKHYEWLKSTSTPVYMLDVYEDVPASVKYPLEEVIEDLYGNTQAIPYFTSSVGWALGLAIYKRYKKIEIYGVEMETNTEYGHQRVGVAYLIGFARGRGVQVDFHSATGFFNAPLYGYEGNVRLDVEYFEKRLKILEAPLSETEKIYQSYQKSVNSTIEAYIDKFNYDLSGLDPVVKTMAQKAFDFGFFTGAYQTIEYYRDKCVQMQKETGDYLIVRQEYEMQMHGAGKQMNSKVATIYSSDKPLADARHKLDIPTNKDGRIQNANAFNDALEVFMKQAIDAGVTNGKMKENQNLLIEVDKVILAAGGQKALEIMQAEMVNA